MKDQSTILLIIGIFFFFFFDIVRAQHLHVAEGKTVLFGKDTIGDGTVGSKFMWLPAMGGALRAGYLSYDGSVGNATGFWDPPNVGYASIALGNNTRASGAGSVSIGIRSNATNFGAVSLGHLSRCNGNSALSVGYYNRADAFVSVALGPGNVGGGNPYIWVETDPLFEVGRSIDTSSRHNALTILKNGKTGIDTHSPQASLHIKQLSSFSEGGLRLEYNTDNDYWENWIDGANDYNFGFNGTLKAYILDNDGSYIIGPCLNQLNPFTYRFKSANDSTTRSWALSLSK